MTVPQLRQALVLHGLVPRRGVKQRLLEQLAESYVPDLTVPQLKAELEQRGLSKTGNKAHLIVRLAFGE